MRQEFWRFGSPQSADQRRNYPNKLTIFPDRDAKGSLNPQLSSIGFAKHCFWAGVACGKTNDDAKCNRVGTE
jgi:hypothetical protein